MEALQREPAEATLDQLRALNGIGAEVRSSAILLKNLSNVCRRHLVLVTQSASGSVVSQVSQLPSRMRSVDLSLQFANRPIEFLRCDRPQPREVLLCVDGQGCLVALHGQAEILVPVTRAKFRIRHAEVELGHSPVL